MVEFRSRCGYVGDWIPAQVCERARRILDWLGCARPHRCSLHRAGAGEAARRAGIRSGCVGAGQKTRLKTAGMRHPAIAKEIVESEKRKSGTLVTRYSSFPHKRCATNSKACPTRPTPPFLQKPQKEWATRDLLVM